MNAFGLPADAPPMHSFPQARDYLQQRRLDHLAKIEVDPAWRRQVTHPDQKVPEEGGPLGMNIPFIKPISAEIMIGWINDNAAAMNAARAAKGTGGADPDWQAVLFNFMEAIATYLRDDKKTIEAIDAAHSGRLDDAYTLLKEAEQPIVKVANALKMDFTILCDLVDQHPVDKKHMFWNGAYAASFQSRDKENMFRSVCFKGTSYASDVAVDVSFTPQAAIIDQLWGCEVSEGFYNGLFGKFHVANGWTQILTHLNVLQSTITAVNDPIPFHVTGHSMGGAYSTLFYAQFLLQYNGKPEVPVSATNICTFGSPRLVVGQKDHVEAGICGRLAAILKNGGPSGVLNSWRIVNRNDICPTIPPVLLLKKYEFNHVDAGTQIFKNAEPQKLKSELGVGIPPVYQKGHWFDHMPWEYYQAILNCLPKV